MKLARDPFSLFFFSVDQTASQGPEFVPTLLKGAFGSPALRDIDADSRPADDGAPGVANAKDVVEHPDRFVRLDVSEANLDLALAVAFHTREKLIGEELLVFGEEVVLNLNLASCFEIIQTDQAQARGIDIEPPEIKVAHADEFQAPVSQRDEFLPFLLSAPSFGDIGDRTQHPGSLFGLDGIQADLHGNLRAVLSPSVYIPPISHGSRQRTAEIFRS